MSTFADDMRRDVDLILATARFDWLDPMPLVPRPDPEDNGLDFDGPDCA